MKKLLIVAEEFYPINTTTASNITTITEELTNNFDVSVICNSSLDSKNELQFIKNKIYRIKELSISKKNLLSRLIRLIISSIKLSYYTLKMSDQKTHILAMTNPIFIVIFLAILKRIKSIEYTILVYDIFPDNLVAIGVLKKNSFLYKILMKIFNWAYSKADNLIVIGRDMEEIINKKVFSDTNIHFIPNWCDVNQIKSLSKNNNEIINALNLDDKIIFAFVGNLGRVQGIDNLLATSKLIKNPNFALLFIGNGVKKNDILNHINNKITENVYYAGSYPFSEQNLILNACDIAIVSLSDSMYGLGVPSKSYYNMAVAKPLLYIGDVSSEIGRIITTNKNGWVVEPNNDILLAQTIEEICNNSLEINKKGNKSKEVVMNFYTKEIVMKQYQQLFQEVLKND